MLLGIYRPGSDPLTPRFFDELSTVHEQLVSYRCPVFAETLMSTTTCATMGTPCASELLQSFGFVQHVTEPTHARGHTLDLVITKSETTVLNLHVGGMISDHALIGFVLPRKKPIAKAHWVTC